MSRVNDIHSSIWAEDDFLDLDPSAKLIYVWAFSNPAVPLSGIFETGTRAIEFATGLSRDTVSQGVDTLCAARFLVREGRTIFVRTRAKHITSKSRSTALNIARDVARLEPESPIRAAFLAQYGDDDGAWNGLLQGALTSVLDDMPDTSSQGGDTVSHPREGVPEGGDTLRGRGRGLSSSREEDARAGASAPASLKFGGKVIPRAVLTAATAILDDFNEKAGTNFRQTTGQGKLAADFRVIVGAILDDDRLTAEVGSRMVARCLADPAPFWRDTPTTKPHPGVVFGENMRARNLQAALDAPKPMSMRERTAAINAIFQPEEEEQS